MLCPFLSSAQSYTFEDLTEDTLQTVTEVFANVDLTQVPSGRLLEHTYPFVDPVPFDGIHLNADNLINFDTFGYAYATVYGMSVDNNALRYTLHSILLNFQ